MKQRVIRISGSLYKQLDGLRKDNPGFEDLIWDLIEPYLELSTETKRDIADSLNEYKKGKIHPVEKVIEELDLKRIIN